MFQRDTGRARLEEPADLALSSEPGRTNPISAVSEDRHEDKGRSAEEVQLILACGLSVTHHDPHEAD